MKIFRGSYVLVTIAALFFALIGMWSFAQNTQPLATYVPTGSLLYLEASDFSRLVHDWNASPEKQTWLKTANYQVFSQSRLLLRLTDAQKEFATAAGVPPDMALVENLAGAESGLALYDIGKLQFLYITRLPSARAMASTLWKLRGQFQSRSSSGLEYFVKEDPVSHRVAAFAAAKDYLLLATREDLLASSLALIAGGQNPNITAEKWFLDATQAAQGNHELRLAMNFERLRKSPHFRSYWIQKNGEDLNQFTSVIADLERTGSEFRENRVLLRSVSMADLTANERATAQLLRLVPDNAGLYRAWAAPSSAAVTSAIERKLLAPETASIRDMKSAPGATLGEGVSGTEEDLETMVDEPPLADANGRMELAALQRVIEGAKVTAMLQVQSTRPAADGVFVGTEFAIVLQSANSWNSQAVRDALTASVDSLWTTSRLGANWTQRNGYFELNGLGHLLVAVSDRTLIIADRADLTVALLAKMSAAPAQGAVYAAGYRHARELGPFEKMMRLIDKPQAGEGDQKQPQFFSDNIGSLGRTLARVKSATITMHDNGAAVRQNVVYSFTR